MCAQIQGEDIMTTFNRRQTLATMGAAAAVGLAAPA
ncbi:MAG TPA: ABC transporter substrate-binding protein, partial [Sulfitobacter sp.]|nr:ABC transporter substrate-binding protein [Sulfitobacter sp.]